MRLVSISMKPLADPTIEIALDDPLHRRDVPGQSGTTQSLEHDALSPSMGLSVEKRETPPTEQFLNVRGHRAFAHDQRAIDKLFGQFRTSHIDRLTSENRRAKNTAVGSQPLFDESKTGSSQTKVSRRAAEARRVPGGRFLRRCRVHRILLVVEEGSYSSTCRQDDLPPRVWKHQAAGLTVDHRASLLSCLEHLDQIEGTDAAIDQD